MDAQPCQWKLARWLAWFGFGLLSTSLLLTPMPTEVVKQTPLGAPFGMWANVGHVLAYLCWTLLTALLPVTPRWRWAWLLAVFAHAFASEVLQGFVPTRHPDWQDIGWDLLGIGIGLALSRRRWRG